MRIFSFNKLFISTLVVAAMFIGGMAYSKAASYTGAGWIRLNSTATSSEWFPGASPSPDATPYTMYMDSNGNIGGYAWSSNYGWLSFNAGDLTGCPDSNPANCKAWTDLSTGQVNGWARFLGFNDASSSGWVELRGNVSLANGTSQAFGVCFGKTINWNDPSNIGGTCAAAGSQTNAFSGWAWGGNGAGWIKISGSVSLPVRMPQNFKVSSVSTSSVTLSWTNPQAYSEIDIYQADGVCQNEGACSFRQPAYQITDPSLLAASKSASDIKSFQTPAGQLKPANTYSFFLRAFP